MLNATRIFLKVVEHQSFSKAAKSLNMVPSSVTRQVDALERELGVCLLKRSTRQLNLTEEGRVFLDGGAKLVACADDIKASLKQVNAEPEGTLRMSAFESFGRLHICPILPEFLARYPKVQVELQLDNRIVDLNADSVDLAIRIGQPADSSLRGRKLLTSKTVICATPAYFQRFSYPQTPKELSEHNCLLIGQKRQKNYWYFKRDHQSEKVLVNGNFSSRGGTPIVEAVLHDVGITQISHWFVQAYIRDGILEPCLSEWQCALNTGPASEVYCVYQDSKYIKPALRAMIDFLATHCSA
ncbi:MAG: transcriptional regulator [Alteromonadaceae bacterium]|nr:MAG: transcriptional regulator [Alteromonadaceae bacterium]